MSLIFELQRVHGTSEWKELVSEVEWNLGAVHDFRTTRQLEDNRKGLEQQDQVQTEK